MNNLLTTNKIQISDESNVPEIIDYFHNEKNFPFVAFNITIEGPSVAYSDFKKWPIPGDFDNVELQLQQLAVNYITAIGNGHNYTSGVYELPASNSKFYRMLIVSMNSNSGDGLQDHQRYLQFGIFIPMNVMKLMPSLISLEDVILSSIENHFPSPWDLSINNITDVKNHLLTIILLSILNLQERISDRG